MNNTVRKFPRSMQEAFPSDYAEAIERPRGYSAESAGHRFVLAVCLVGLCGLVASMLAGWLQ